MELNRALEIFEYNKAMLTCDMSISRDPEHQDVSPDYYGKDAEDLYYAIVFIEKYLDNSIPTEWIENWKKGKTSIEQVVADKIMMDYKYRDYWEKENERP